MRLEQNEKEEIKGTPLKVGTSRRYWEALAKDVAAIADRHMKEVESSINSPALAPEFSKFLAALKENLNLSITAQEAVEMLAQHMVTKPMFDALFENYAFIKRNPVSLIMQDMMDALEIKPLKSEQETLQKFFFCVRERAKTITSAEGKQKFIAELYEEFFKFALPKQVERLGIVYTPIEIVDFILKSVEYVLNKNLGRSLNDEGVHILDPFAGTGTFFVRLLKSGLISPERLSYKYSHELHANEIVLLAYYIAAINIEETYHGLAGASEYTPFEGMVLADTFELGEISWEKSKRAARVFSNSERGAKQLGEQICVIVGNPPYSVGQRSANDNNQNISYPHLDKSLAESYVAGSKAKLTRSAYDTYIKAFRYATDRLQEDGVIAFVSNGAYIDSVALDGFRGCLMNDFNSVYVFNLRGNARTSGEKRKKEAGNVFASGTRTPVAITVLVRKKGEEQDGFVHYFDVGDYLSREQKLLKISQFASIENIPWEILKPNEKNDWIEQRDPAFASFIPLGDKKHPEALSVFKDDFSAGLKTNRDAFVYNFSADAARQNANAMVDFYNAERARCHQRLPAEGLRPDEKARRTYLIHLKCNDETKISWSEGLVNLFCKNAEIAREDEVKVVSYRPFCKKYLSYNKPLIERPSKWASIFPDPSCKNEVMCVSGAGSKKVFSVIVTNTVQDFQLNFNAQCFPMYIYETGHGPSLQNRYKKRSSISDGALKIFRNKYGNKVEKEDIFYYIYAVLQSKEYVARYKDNLSKEMPRIPLLENFSEYARIGRELAKLHLAYENKADFEALGLKLTLKKPNFRVTKMRFKKEGINVCKDTIFFNEDVTIENIPLRAYEYVVNGRSAVEWVMERYAFAKDAACQIIDDPNLYGDEKYVFNLLISVISLSIKTQDLLDSLPEYREL